MATRKFGKAEVEVSIRDRVGQGLKAIEKKMTRFGSGLSRLGGAVAGIGTVGVAAFAGVAKQFADYGDSVEKMAGRTGVSAEALSTLGFAAGQSGTSIATVEKGIRKMQQTVTEAADGTQAQAEALAAVGLSAEQLAGMSPDQQFEMLAEAISKIEDPTTKAARAMDIFGRSGTELLPMFNGGAAGIQALRKEARDLGHELTSGDAANAAALTDAMGRIAAAAKGVTLQIGAALAPALTVVANAVSQMIVPVVTFIRENRNLIVTIFAGAAAAVALGTAMAAAGGLIVALGVTIGSITAIASAAFAALGVAVSVITSPITLVVAAIAGLGYLALEASGGLATLANMFGTLGETAKTAWGGIVAAISNGDLQAAGEIAFLSLQIAYQTVMQRMKETWADVVFFLKSAWLGAVKGIIDIGSQIYFGTAKYFDLLTNSLVNGFDTAFTYIRGAIDQIITRIAQAGIEVQRYLGLLSAADAATANKILEDDQARAAAGRQSGLGQRAGARADALNARDSARRQTQSDFGSIIGQMLTAQRGTVDRSGLDAANAELAAKQTKLGELASAQAALAQAQNEAKKPDAKLAGIPRLAAAAGVQASKTKAIGTSSAAAVAAGVLGVANRPAEDTAKNTAKIASQMQKILLRPSGGLT